MHFLIILVIKAILWLAHALKWTSPFTFFFFFFPLLSRFLSHLVWGASLGGVFSFLNLSLPLEEFIMFVFIVISYIFVSYSDSCILCIFFYSWVILKSYIRGCKWYSFISNPQMWLGCLSHRVFNFFWIWKIWIFLFRNWNIFLATLEQSGL